MPAKNANYVREPLTLWLVCWGTNVADISGQSGGRYRCVQCEATVLHSSVSTVSVLSGLCRVLTILRAVHLY